MHRDVTASECVLANDTKTSSRYARNRFHLWREEISSEVTHASNSKVCYDFISFDSLPTVAPISTPAELCQEASPLLPAAAERPVDYRGHRQTEPEAPSQPTYRFGGTQAPQ